MPQLNNLDVEFVSLVDRAACRDAVEQSEPMRFYLWKRETPSQGGHPMKLTKEILDSLGEGVVKSDDLNKLVEKAEDAEEVAKALDGVTRLLTAHKGDLTPEIVAEVVKAAGFELPTPKAPGIEAKTASEVVEVLKKADVDPDVVSEIEAALEKAAKKEEIDKADLPAAVREALEKAEDDRKAAAKKAEDAERIAKEERDTRLTKEFVAKAEGYEALSVEPEKFGPILKAASEKLSKEENAELERVLKSADEALAKSELFKEQGRGGVPSPGDAYAEVLQKAEELRKSDSKLSEAEAMEQVLQSDRELQERYLAEVRA